MHFYVVFPISKTLFYVLPRKTSWSTWPDGLSYAFLRAFAIMGSRMYAFLRGILYLVKRIIRVCMVKMSHRFYRAKHNF
jgi:hypothetical protein